jgi:hypothetical protein
MIVFITLVSGVKFSFDGAIKNGERAGGSRGGESTRPARFGNLFLIMPQIGWNGVRIRHADCSLGRQHWQKFHPPLVSRHRVAHV